MAVLRSIGIAAAVALVVAACEPLAPSAGDFPRVTPPANAQIDPAVRAAYEESAAIMALRFLQETQPAALDSVRLPEALVTSLYNALLRVYAAEHPVRDSVVDIYRIRTFPRPTVREVMFRADRSQTWLQRLRNNERPTGNAGVDDLVSRYNLVREHYSEWPTDGTALISLRGDRPLNTEALAKRFNGVAGVIDAEPNGFAGDGNDIRAERRPDGWRLTYSVGFGDCPAGCIGRTSWPFTIGTDGSVRYHGRTGDPPPPPQW